jgi:putative transcriptional regulator
VSIRHHISDETIISYASGSLAEGWGLVVATHMALCPSCRQRLAEAEMVGGELLDAVPEIASDKLWLDGLWATQLSRLTGSEEVKVESLPQRPAGQDFILPEPLRSYVGGDVDALKWQPLGLGAYQIRIDTGDGQTTARLLKIPAGKPVPAHSHRGLELTLVLSGSFHDSRGLFARGDMEEVDESLTHQPIALPEADCICLAVTDAPLRFNSRFLRAIQPLLGI